ncbi:MAG TPA: TerB family tellurite resistance protein [Deferrisomatales bacterium]|nr:TerB family tellurite resistance protein [Deferrisomatales bacterium]
MGLSGKLLGAGLGYFLGGPLGAVIGGIIGHYVKDASLPAGQGPGASDPRVRQQQQELYFVASLVGILTAMIQADGDVRKEEVATIRRFFSERLGYRGESLEIVRDLIKQFLRQRVDLDSLCADVVQRAEYATRLLLVECLLDVAMADGHLHPQERLVFDRCVGLLGISAADADGIRARSATGPSAGTRRCSDCEVLGVAADGDEATVKKAYRELVKKYHPDRVSHLGEEFRDLAHQKFLEIQNAYDRLCKSRGWT